MSLPKTGAELEQHIEERRGQLTDWVYELQQRDQDTALLRETSDLIQACVSAEEAYLVIPEYVSRLFPANSGAVCILDRSAKLVETVASWGDAEGWEKVFPPERCWSLRRARAHRREPADTALRCTHLSGSFTGWYLCIPLMAHGQPIGLLHLNGRPREAGVAGLELGDGSHDPASLSALTPYKQQLAETAAEQLGIALANLQLREALRSHAIRDSLTGLFNRRYMEEALAREIRRAERVGSSLGCMLIDIDHFKTFNDARGQAAGDSVLRQLGSFVLGFVRSSDIACRYGGEEFMLILTDASLEVTRLRAEEIRAKAGEIGIEPGDRRAAMSLSIGVAAFPGHGDNTASLLRAASQGLCQAKSEGRNRVCVADTVAQTADRCLHP